MKNSILYFFLEGFSRGGIQLFLLFVSYGFSENIYITLMLLISLETLVALFFPTNYIDALLPLFKKYTNSQIFSNFFVLNFTFFLLFICIFIFYLDELKQYYNYYNSYVYFLVLLNVFFMRWLYFSAFMKQIEEKHLNAIKIKSIPFLLSLLFAIIFVLLLDDKVMGFFIGKSLGLFLYYVYLIKQESIKIFFNRMFLVDFISRSKFLLLTSLLGWSTGYGFLNIAHTFYSGIDTRNFGYMLNIYMIFLMITFGIIQVLRPKILTLIENRASTHALFNYYIKIILLFLLIAFVSYIFSFLLKEFRISDFIIKIIENIDFAILLFLLVSIESITKIFIYAKDKIKIFTYLLVSTEIIAWAMILTLIYLLNVNMFLVYFSLILIRVIITVYYGYKKVIQCVK